MRFQPNQSDLGAPPTNRNRASVAAFGFKHLKGGNMGLAQYSIVPVRDQWAVLHDGNTNGEYAPKEAAFEAAATAASLAIRQGYEVHVSVPGVGPRQG